MRVRVIPLHELKESPRWSYLADPLLRNGYCVQEDVRGVLLSLFKFHNETLNVWIHLLGGVLFLTLSLLWTKHLLFGNHPEQVVENIITRVLGDHYLLRMQNLHALLIGQQINQQCPVIPWQNDSLVCPHDKENPSFFPSMIKLQEEVLQSVQKFGDYIEDQTLHELTKFQHVLDDIHASLPPTWPIAVFCFGGTMCLLCSSLYHLFLGLDKQAMDLFCRVDLAGISFMMLGSLIPPITYTFHCHPHMINIYVILGAMFCLSTLFFCMLPAHLMHKLKAARVFSYIGAGSFLVIPFIDAGIRYGFDSLEVNIFVANGRLIQGILVYLVGVCIYIFRIPERWIVMHFDYVFASHQLWHVCVLSAAYIHYLGVLYSYNQRLELPSCTLNNHTDSSI